MKAGFVLCGGDDTSGSAAPGADAGQTARIDGGGRALSDGSTSADVSAPGVDSAGIASGGTATGGGIFDAPEPWTTDVSGLTKDARSDAIIVALGGWGSNTLQVNFSIPLFFADSSTPHQTIIAPAGGYCYGGPDCDPVPLQMPLPATGNAERSTT